MKYIISSITILISIILFSCKGNSKNKIEADNALEVSSEKTINGKQYIDDKVAKEMMDMIGMEGETFHDMMKTDSLESKIMKMFSPEQIQKMISASGLSEAEQAEIISKLKEMESQNESMDKNALKYSKNEMTDYFKELEKVLVASGSEKQLKELQNMMENGTVNDKISGLSKKQVDPKIESLRKVLDTDQNSFIEEDLTSYSLYGNREKREALQKLRTVSKDEGSKILAAYYQVSQKELELLKTMPLKQLIPSESEARNLLNKELPEPIKSHNKSGKASVKFKSMTEYFIQEQQGRAKGFVQKAAEARHKFYEENPGWYGEKSETGDTYVDSRYQYIYLPLGELSFADKVISHELGNPPGSHKEGSVGSPDFAMERFDKADPRICNLGERGILTLEFTDNAIADVNGPDLYIFEMGQIEPTNLEISKDGKNWIDIGKITGGTAKVDIAPFITKGETFKYIKLTDLASRSELPGADVDAVAAIGGALRLNLDSAVLFDTGKFKLKESASSELQKLVSAIQKIPKAKIIVEGHTDNVGNPQKNQTLSENRAQEVSAYLKTKLSNKYNLEVKGYGESQPLAPNDTEENKQKNRRVEILVIPS